MWCCYKLVDENKNIFYIGKTSIERLNSRKIEHIYESKNRKDYKSNKIKKILKEDKDFSIIPIRFYKNEEDAYNDEINLIEFYKNMGHILTNSCKGGEGLRSPSFETRQKLARNARKRFLGEKNPSKMSHVKKLRSDFFKKNNPMKNQKIKKKTIEKIIKSCAKPVIQLDKNGNVIKKYESINAAVRATKISKEGISRTCRGMLNSSGGFKWKFNNSMRLGG